MVGVDVTIPKGFELQRAVDAPGWTEAIEGSTISFRGGVVPAGACGTFTLVGVIPKKGTFAFELTVLGEDGSTRKQTSHDPNDHLGALLVYAGTPLPGDEAPDDKKGPAIPLPVIAGTIGVGVVILLFRIRRANKSQATPVAPVGHPQEDT